MGRGKSACKTMTNKLDLTGEVLSLEKTSPVPVHTDRLHRYLYGQDASVYALDPLGVAFPRNAGELQQLVKAAALAKIPLVPRAAGTSLAGQATGTGLVVDTGRHMNRILELNVEEKWVRVEPGVILDDLNRYLAPHGLFFGPDTSTSNRCMIGGMVGNNSCGSHSILYGNTMAHVLELDVIFADGTRETLKDWTQAELEEHRERQDALGNGLRAMDAIICEHRQTIEDAYPPRALVRRNTGYPLDDVIWRAPYSQDETPLPFNLARFLCGTEGTLALTVEAKLNLVEKPTHTILVCAQFHDLIESLEATVLTLPFNPAAVELIDRRILNETKHHLEHQHNRFFIEGDPDAVLVIEFYRNSVEEAEEAASAVIKALQEAQKGYAFPIVRPPHDTKVWNLRKAGLGLLMGIPGDVKAVSVVEDTAVEVERLPAYIAEFMRLMETYGTDSVYHAHASVGELHLRPELDLKNPEDVRKFIGIATDTTDLVKRYRGSLSGEHGDGRVRSPLLERFFGPEVYALHRKIKAAFDPDCILNPNIIIDPDPIDAHFRVAPGSETPELTNTWFDWSSDLGFMRALEKCNGAGACRKLPDSGGTMCPSYMATRDEKDSTRGRANVFRQVFLNENQDWMKSEELDDALKLCLSCKACKSECPASVDMARLKAEFLQHKFDAEGIPLRNRLMGNYANLSRLAMIAPALANASMRWKVTRSILGVSLKRQMPAYARQSARTWFATHRSPATSKSLWLYVDPFTDFTEPHLAIEATRVFEHLGWEVELFPIEDDGRTLISKGLLRQAKQLSDQNMARVQELLKAYPDRSVVGIEPSALLTFRDETVDLVSPKWKTVAADLAGRAVLFDEFLAGQIAAGEFPTISSTGQQVAFHAHCHQKALAKGGLTEKMLTACGYEVSTMKTGCCGMAGSFGYEEEHYDLSMKVGELQLFPLVRKAANTTLIAAVGTSCRHQIKDGTEREAIHPITLVARALLATDVEQR